MSETPSSDPLLGRLLGDFVVQDKLGEGGFGAVYRAEQPLLARQAVIKVLHGKHRASENLIQRFLREAKLASKLDHPYAAHTYAFGAEPDGLLWIAMELVRGTPLDRLLATTGPVSLERFVPLLDKLCEVLATAHEQGIVHRDIKPANVMVLARAGRLLPKLLDFGIAKTLDSEPVLGPAAALRFESGPIAVDTTSGGAVTARGAELDRTAAGADGNDGDGIALTRAGSMLGSPPYMAPEQWVNAPNIGPRTDLYALGALTFEALTGRPPFAARSTMAMAKAHAQQPVPPLGEAFPVALDRVLQKAMAKRPDARYGNALELAAAFREAAGFAADPDSLPRLDEAIRDAAIGELPQPLAEAVAGYEAARNLHQAYEALGEICAIAAHLVGVIALCARTRVGAGEGDSSAAQEILRILRRRTLADVEWIDLARALVRPFTTRPDAHPLPELVTLFGLEEPFTALFTVFTDRGRAPAGESETRARLEHALPAVQRLLRALAFLGDYPLAVARGGVAERWTGLRRGRRTSTPLARPAPDGQPLLLGRDDAPVLALWPLVQIGEPVPGAAEELFLLEGQGRHAAKLVARPGGFERRDDEIWPWLRAHVGGGDGDREARDEERAPYRGLAAFTAADADLFVGRERESEAVANRIRIQPFVAVVGPSGAGKSSFLHAGVLPALPAQWQVLALRPGPSPLTSLCVRVSNAAEAAALAERVRATPGALRDLLCARDGMTLIVIDQFEETFTLGSDDAERGAFLDAIAAATRTADDPVRVVITLRDDFLMRAEAEPALRPRLQRGLQLVGTPSREDLERILVEPARRAGYDFEDAALPAEMVAGVAGRPGALPLLSFTASKLWELRDRHYKQLPRKVYDALGGVAGALAQHAEQTLEAMSADEQRLVREAFRHLVTAEGTRAVLSREELLQVLGRAEQAGAVIERLIASRLLAASEAEGGGDRVEVAHEALLVAWPRLVRWRQEDAEGARLRDQLRAAARQWDERGRPAGLLWRDEALAELQVWRTRHGAALTVVDAAFADGSVAQATRGRRRNRTIAVGAFVVLIAGSLGLVRANQQTRASERVARGKVAELYEDQGRQALLDEDPYRAFIYLLEAVRGGRDGVATRVLVGRAMDGISALQTTIAVHGANIATAVRSRDRRRVLTAAADGTVRVTNLDTGRRTFDVRLDAMAWGAVFASDERKIVVAVDDGTLRWFDAGDGTPAQSLTVPGRGESMSAFGKIDDAGTRLYLARGNTVSVWDAARAALLYQLDALDPIERTELAITANGASMVTASFAGHLRAWRTADGQLVFERVLPEMTAVAYAPDGKTLSIGFKSGLIQLLDAGSGHTLHELHGHVGEIRALAWSPDGRTLASGSNDHTVRVWDSSGGVRFSLVGHRGPVPSVTFAESGPRLLTVSPEGSPRVWDASDGQLVGVLASTEAWFSIFGWDGEQALTFGADGSIRRYATTHCPLQRAFDTGDKVRHIAIRAASLIVGGWHGTVGAYDWQRGASRWNATIPANAEMALVFVGAGEPTLALALAEDRSTQDAAVLWRLPDRTLVARLESPGTPISSWTVSEDGSTVVTGHIDGSVRVFSAVTGQMLKTFPGTGGALRRVWRSPDGGQLAAGSEADSAVHRWDLARGVELPPLLGHLGMVEDIAYSKDGQLIASASNDRTVRVWSRDGTLVAVLEGHHDNVLSVAFRQDSELLASTSLDGTARVWSARTGRLLATYPADQSTAWAVAFDDSGANLFTGGEDKRVKVWRVPVATEPLNQLERFGRCRVPFALDGGKVTTRKIEADCDNL